MSSGIGWDENSEKQKAVIRIENISDGTYRVHIQNALRHGATVDELFEVLQLIPSLGNYSCTVGVPILAKESETAKSTLTGLGRRFQLTISFWCWRNVF